MYYRDSSPVQLRADYKAAQPRLGRLSHHDIFSVAPPQLGPDLIGPLNHSSRPWPRRYAATVIISGDIGIGAANTQTLELGKFRQHNIRSQFCGLCTFA